AALVADRLERIVVDLTAFDEGQPFVEQAGQGTRQTRLGLPPLAEEDDVLSGNNRVFYLGDDSLFEADNALELRLVRLELFDQLVAQLFLDGSRPITRFLQLAKGLCAARRGIGRSLLRHVRHNTARLSGRGAARV